MKNLGILYRRQEKYQAAETLEDAILRAKKQQTQSAIPSTMENIMEASMMASTSAPDNASMTSSSIGRMSNSPSASGIKSRLMNALGLQPGNQ
jgi:hypothetical protein